MKSNSKHKIALLGLLIIVYTVPGCKSRGIDFDPNFHIGDSQTMSIVDRDGNQVYADEEGFNSYACMHNDKVNELKDILTRARLPERVKKSLLEKLDIIR